eukprot:203534-Amphidinium_carterae.1
MKEFSSESGNMYIPRQNGRNDTSVWGVNALWENVFQSPCRRRVLRIKAKLEVLRLARVLL